jgi:hypothetical protein
MGLPTMIGRQPSPPPVMFRLGDVPALIASGAPLMKLVISEICQLSNSARTSGFGSTRLSFGMSHRKWKVKMLGRSYEANP